MIDLWISRSGALPLHVELDFSRPTSYPALEALIPHSDRWEYVSFDLTASSIAILDHVKSRLHSLKSLNVSFTNSDDIGTIDFCEVAPRLTEIALGSIVKPVIIKLPWEQLRVCTSDNTEIAHYVLQHAKNLRVLRLDIEYKALEPFTLMQGSPHACHLGLDTLIVKIDFDHELDVTVDHVNSFFRSITFPSLQTLKLDFTYYNRPGGSTQFDIIEGDRAALASTLAGFFERSCTRLSKLKLIDIPFSQSALIECLAFSPSLVSLCIQFDRRWHAIGDELLHRLDANRPMHILPRLRSISLQLPEGTLQVVEESMKAMITSRI